MPTILSKITLENWEHECWGGDIARFSLSMDVAVNVRANPLSPNPIDVIHVKFASFVNGLRIGKYSVSFKQNSSCLIHRTTHELSPLRTIYSHEIGQWRILDAALIPPLFAESIVYFDGRPINMRQIAQQSTVEMRQQFISRYKNISDLLAEMERPIPEELKDA